jgi:hypothetical protein
MSITAILEVALGLVFIWFGLSLASMYIQEWLVGKLGWRSSMLEAYLTNLLADPGLAAQFYAHPLIQGLHSGADGDQKPSYIPSAQFSTALIDMIRDAPKEASLIQKTLYELRTETARLSKDKKALAQEQINLALNLTRRALETEGGQEMADTLLNEAKEQIRKLSTDFPGLQGVIEAKFTEFASQKKQIDSLLAHFQMQNGGQEAVTTLQQIRLGLAVLSVSQPQLKQAVEALITGLEEYTEQGTNTYLQARKNIETWFDSGMERLSGWYKRRSQTLAFLIGVGVAVFINVDSLQVVSTLWRDPLVRQSIANQATTFVDQNPEGAPTLDAEQLAQLQAQISQFNIPIGWVGSALPIDSYGAAMMGDGTQKLCTLTPKSSVELFGMRVGKECYPLINTPNFNDLTGWLLKLVGLLISGVAAAQGAPFWFDILKNIVNIRTSGTKPAENGTK